jgi:UDP-glucuronate 4-epimerase
LKILVTGGAGFIGSHLIDRLVERGDEVLCLDAFNDFYSPAIKRRNIGRHVESDAITLVEGDVLDAKVTAEVFEGFRPERVVHLAARVAVRPSIASPLLYEQVNVQGTMRLLELSAKHKVKQFILASSSSVYGNNEKVPFSEDDPVDHPISPYAASKKAAELMCHTYHHLFGLPVTCLRFFTVYGPRQRPDLAIHKFTRLIDEGRPIPKFGDGSTRRDYTYCDDIVQGVEEAIERVFDYEVINLGESRTVSLGELIAAIETVTGKKALIDAQPEQPGDVKVTYADIGKAKRLLGYAPKFPLEAGLARFWEWYQENRELLATPR